MAVKQPALVPGLPLQFRAREQRCVKSSVLICAVLSRCQLCLWDDVVSLLAVDALEHSIYLWLLCCRCPQQMIANDTIFCFATGLEDPICWYIVSMPGNTTEQSERSFANDGRSCQQTSAMQNFVVGYAVVPSDAEDPPLTALVEWLQSPPVQLRNGPSFQAVEEYCENARCIYADFRWCAEIRSAPDVFQTVHYSGGQSDTSDIFSAYLKLHSIIRVCVYERVTGVRSPFTSWSLHLSGNSATLLTVTQSVNSLSHDCREKASAKKHFEW